MIHRWRRRAPSRAGGCASCSSWSGLASRHARALPARVLGRPAPAHRHRARARAEPQVHRLRRAGLGARRLDPGADHQPAAGPAGRARADLPVHLARPRRGAAHRRPGRGDVPRPDRRDRRQAAPLRQPAAPLHPGACWPRSRCRGPGRRRRASAVRGDVPSPSDPPPGCRFHTRCPHVMDVCRRLEPKLLARRPGPGRGLPPGQPAGDRRDQRDVSLPWRAGDNALARSHGHPRSTTHDARRVPGVGRRQRPPLRAGRRLHRS